MQKTPAPSPSDAGSRGFSLAELIVAITACAAYGATLTASKEGLSLIDEPILIPVVFCSAVTGGIVGAVIAVAQEWSLRITLLAALFGVLAGAGGAMSLLLRVSWPHVVFGSLLLIAVALVCRVITGRLAAR